MRFFGISISKTILCILILISSTAMGQHFEEHRWKNRIILVFNSTLEIEMFEMQISELKRYEEGLKERKLLIYQIKPDTYNIGLDEKDHWQSGVALYETFNPKQKAFKIILIGLDGSIKLEQTQFLSAQKLFSIIDAMPMRRAELKEKGN